jgi:hypothetical protein
VKSILRGHGVRCLLSDFERFLRWPFDQDPGFAPS